MIADVRLAWRALRQSPTFTLVAVLSLALGIGASTSVYSLISTLFFAPPAGVSDPDGLVRVHQLLKGQPKDHQFSYPEYAYYRDHATVFSELASDNNPKTLTDTENGDQLLTAVVSPNYFTALGIQPHAGRFFLPEEDTAAGFEPVVVLSHAFWQRRFASDANRIGTRLSLGSTSYTIVGVTPAKFAGTSAGWTPDIFVTNRAVFSEKDLANGTELDFIGRLKSGRTLDEAQAEITVLWRAFEQAQPKPKREGVVVSTLRGVEPEARSSQARLPMLLAAIVGCLLLIACVNLAGLLQTRHSARAREIAIRVALGARKGRVVRQLLAESLLLSQLGGVAGLIVAWWGTLLLERAYAREMFEGTRHFYPLALDGSAFLSTMLIAAVTGVVFGLAPALQASRPAMLPALKEDRSAPMRSRLRAAFLVVQVALSLVLLIGAALAIQSARTVWTNPGFDAGHVAYFYINPARAGYRDDKATLYTSHLRQRLEAHPLVESISFSWVPPPFAIGTSSIAVAGDDTLKVPANWVAPRFFDTLRIPVISGRGIEQRDIDNKHPVVVVNEALARRLWPNQDAVGRTLTIDGSTFEIAGVVHYEGLREEGDATRPYVFASDSGRRQLRSVLVRVKGDAAASLLSLKREIRAVDATVPIHQAMALADVIARQEVDVPIAMGVLTFAGGLALLLTVLGLYGVVALWVAHRTREIGIRVAIGATSSQIVSLVLGEGARLIVIGLPLGVAAATASVRLLSNYLYGVSATDATTFIVITTSLAAIALLACYVPARRAMRVDPVHALRHD